MGFCLTWCTILTLEIFPYLAGQWKNSDSVRTTRITDNEYGEWIFMDSNYAMSNDVAFI